MTGDKHKELIDNTIGEVICSVHLVVSSDLFLLRPDIMVELLLL